MKFNLSWLKEHLNTNATTNEIIDKLTDLGLEVESVSKPVEGVKIAKVLDAQPHPNADRLKLLKVDIGDKEPLQIVCGAENARAGLIGALATIGTYLPAIDLTIKKSKIRSIESFGMMCSFSELGITIESDGIIELGTDAPIGSDFFSYFGLGSPTIEIAITPNRGDCASIHGIARDLAAADLGNLTNELIDSPVINKLSELNVPTEVCDAFYYCELDNINNQVHLPVNILSKLITAEYKPQTAIDDLCAYLTFTYGIPILAIDKDKLVGQIQLKYKDAKLLLCDNDNIIGYAGCRIEEKYRPSVATKNVILCTGNYSPEAIRAAKIKNILSYRHERGIDKSKIANVLSHPIFQQMMGGDFKEVSLYGKPSYSKKTIILPIKLVTKYTTLDLAPSRIIEILEKLGGEVSQESDSLKVSIPHWRNDLTLAVDLVNEIIRINGLNNITPKPLTYANNINTSINNELYSKTFNNNSDLTWKAKNILASLGLTEIVSWSFISEERSKHFAVNSESLPLSNPISNDKTHMRPSLLPGLIDAAITNANIGCVNTGLFEVANIYKNSSENGQLLYAAGIRQGEFQLSGNINHWRNKSSKVDAYDARNDIFNLLLGLNIDIEKINFTSSDIKYFHPNLSAALLLNDQIIGIYGEIHPDTRDLLGIEFPLAAFELNLTAISGYPKSHSKFTLPNKLSIFRDLSFIMSGRVQSKHITDTIIKSNKYIKDAYIFDIYHNNGNYYIAVRLEIYSEENLISEQIDVVCQDAVNAAEKIEGVVFRRV